MTYTPDRMATINRLARTGAVIRPGYNRRRKVWICEAADLETPIGVAGSRWDMPEAACLLEIQISERAGYG